MGPSSCVRRLLTLFLRRIVHRDAVGNSLRTDNHVKHAVANVNHGITSGLDAVSQVCQTTHVSNTHRNRPSQQHQKVEHGQHRVQKRDGNGIRTGSFGLRVRQRGVCAVPVRRCVRPRIVQSLVSFFQSRPRTIHTLLHILFPPSRVRRQTFAYTAGG